MGIGRTPVVFPRRLSKLSQATIQRKAGLPGKALVVLQRKWLHVIRHCFVEINRNLAIDKRPEHLVLRHHKKVDLSPA